MVNMDLSFYKNRKVFITGHTGFKGTWLSHILIQAGAEITGYSLEPQTDPALFILAHTASKMNSIIGDVRDLENLTRALHEVKPEIVFHLAAQPIVRLSYQEPVITYHTNVMGTVHILEAIRTCSSVKSVVNITTDKVYENKEWLWGYRENENLNGFDPYSNSKSCSELVTASYRNSFFSDSYAPAISTARSGNVIGGGDYSMDRIIPDCIRFAKKNNGIIIRNPHSTRPYQHVLECLSGYLLLAQKQYENKKFAGSYNFGPDDESCVTTGKLVELFCSHWHDATWKVQGDGGPHEATFLKLDCAKAKTVLGWKPKWDIYTAVQETIIWEKALINGEQAEKIINNQIKKYFYL